MPDLRELREQRQKAANRITELADRIARERRDFTTEERTSWDQANGDFDRLGREVETSRRADEVRREQERPVGDRDVGREDYTGRKGRKKADNVQVSEEQRSLAFRAWARSQFELGITREQRRACKALRFNPRRKALDIALWPDRRIKSVQRDLFGAAPERRALIMDREMRANLSAQVPTSGGYLVSPGSLANAFELNLLAFGGVAQIADTITTQSGEPYFWPTVDDTSNSGALLAENTAIGSGVNPTISRKAWYAYKWTSNPVLIPSELLEDDQYDLAGQVGEMLGVRIARSQAGYLATGTGASQPEGIVTGSALGVTTASATAITFDELVRLVHSVDVAYRSMPGVGWLMHDLIKSYIRRIKDGNGRPLWVAGEFYTSGTVDGEPEKLLDYPLNICMEMASTVATGNKTLLFGQLSKYKVRRVRGMRLYRLQERYRDLDQDGFICFVRMDGRLLSAGTNPVKHMLQA